MNNNNNNNNNELATSTFKHPKVHVNNNNRITATEEHSIYSVVPNT